MSSCNAPSPSAPSSCTRSAPSQASGLRPSASEPGRTPMQESRDRASSDGRAPLVASLLESARTKGRKMLCASPDHQLVHVQAAVCGPQNRQYQTSGTTCRIRVDESGNTEANLDSPDQPIHWLIALAATPAMVTQIETEMLAIAGRYFGLRARAADFEFHGAHIFSGRTIDYRQLSVADRV